MKSVSKKTLNYQINPCMSYTRPYTEISEIENIEHKTLLGIKIENSKLCTGKTHIIATSWSPCKAYISLTINVKHLFLISLYLIKIVNKNF